MKRLKLLAATTLIFGAGYLCGQWQLGRPEMANAVVQKEGVDAISNETLANFQKYSKAAKDLQASLEGESLNVTATEDTNFFAISVGGIDAIRDLEEGRGVDPETFAAIYADRVTNEVRAALDTDSDGRIRYKGTVIRLYSKEKLNEVFNRRKQVDRRASQVGG